MIYICILLIYFKVISKKGGHYCPRLPYIYNISFSGSLSSYLQSTYQHHSYTGRSFWPGSARGWMDCAANLAAPEDRTGDFHTIHDPSIGVSIVLDLN